MEERLKREGVLPTSEMLFTIEEEVQIKCCAMEHLEFYNSHEYNYHHLLD